MHTNDAGYNIQAVTVGHQSYKPLNMQSVLKCDTIFSFAECGGELHVVSVLTIEDPELQGEVG